MMKEKNAISGEQFRQLIKLKKQALDDIVIEGRRLIEQLIDDGIPIKRLYIQADKYDTFTSIINKNIETYILSERQANQLAETQHSQGIFAQITFKTKPILKYNKLIYLNAISDPGNLGTILRTASGFGIDGVILDKDCCDLKNSKVIRASMGAVFTVPIFKVSDTINGVPTIGADTWLAGRKETIIASTISGGTPLSDFRFPSTPYIVVIGSEAHGVSPSLTKYIQKQIYIPMQNHMESLNVAVIAGILMYRMCYGD